MLERAGGENYHFLQELKICSALRRQKKINKYITKRLICIFQQNVERVLL